MELIEILFFSVLISLSPIRDDRPLPKPFLFLKGIHHAALSTNLSLFKNSSVKLKYALLPGQKPYHISILEHHEKVLLIV